jgi:hypothetical protein
VRKFILILLLNILSIALFAPVSGTIIIFSPKIINPFIRVWQAVKIVETGNNPDTINYHEHAYGPGQIHQEKLDDYNLANGTSYTLMDCLNEGISRKIFLWHCSKYNDTDLAIRRWNGSGPATFEYLAKVKIQIIALSTRLETQSKKM